MELKPSVGIVILAAGESKRLGKPKQLLSYRGTTILNHIITTALASNGAKTIAVIGAYSDQMRDEIGELPVKVVENSNWRDGISSSIRLGIETLEQSADPPGAALLMTSDQPFVTTGLIDRIIETYAGEPGRIVACKYEETTGVPALFDGVYYGDLKSLRGDRGAKGIIESHRAKLVTVDFPRGGIDIDTAADMEKL